MKNNPDLKTWRDRHALETLEVALRSAVLARHARLRTTGQPQLCQPTREERAGRAPIRAGSDRKPIFPTRAAAEAAARELEALPGARPLRAYECPRSRHGHHHLATDKNRLPGAVN